MGLLSGRAKAWEDSQAKTVENNNTNFNVPNKPNAGLLSGRAKAWEDSQAKTNPVTQNTTPTPSTITLPEQTPQKSWWESAGSWISENSKNAWASLRDPIKKQEEQAKAELKIMQEREKRGIKTPSISTPSATLNVTPETQEMLKMPIQDQFAYTINQSNKDYLQSVLDNRKQLLLSGKYLSYDPRANLTETEKRRGASAYTIGQEIKDIENSLQNKNMWQTALDLRVKEVGGNFKIAAAGFLKDTANSILSVYDQVALTDEQKQDMARNASSVNNSFITYLGDVINENTYNDPDLGDAITQGVGSIGTFTAATLLTGGGVWIPTILESLQQAGATYDDNIKQGKTPADSFTRSTAVFAGNLVWNRFLNKFSGVFDALPEKELAKLQKNFTQSFINNASRAGTGEAIQEMGQQISYNIATDKPWDEGVIESGGVAFIVGSGAKSLQFVNKKTGKTIYETTDFTLINNVLEKYNIDSIETLNQYSQTKLNPQSSIADIRKAFKEAAFLTNPDFGATDPTVYTRVVQAYNDLIKVRSAQEQLATQEVLAIAEPKAQEPVAVEEAPIPTPTTPVEPITTIAEEVPAVVEEVKPETQIKGKIRIGKKPEVKMEGKVTLAKKKPSKREEFLKKKINASYTEKTPLNNLSIIGKNTVDDIVTFIAKKTKNPNFAQENENLQSKNLIKKIDEAVRVLDEIGMDVTIDEQYLTVKRIKDIIERKTITPVKEEAPEVKAEPKEKKSIKQIRENSVITKPFKRKARYFDRNLIASNWNDVIDYAVENNLTVKKSPMYKTAEGSWSAGDKNYYNRLVKLVNDPRFKSLSINEQNKTKSDLESAIKYEYLINYGNTMEIVPKIVFDSIKAKGGVEVGTLTDETAPSVGSFAANIPESKKRIGEKKVVKPSRKVTLNERSDEEGDIDTEEEIVDEKQKLYDSYEQAEKDLRDALGDTKEYARVLELPELVELSKTLMDAPPEVKDRISRNNPLGQFRERGKGQIFLRTDIFKYPQLARQVLSHELGHLVDWLPNYTLSRGNLLGKLASLLNFTKGVFSNPEVEAKVSKLSAELVEAQEQRRKLKKDNEMNPVEKQKKNSELLKRVKEINKEIDKLNENAFKNKEIRKELIQWSLYWRNIDPVEFATLPKTSPWYRYITSTDELYADAISGIFSSPLKFQQTSPKFVEAFFANLDAKPEVAQAYKDIQGRTTEEQSAALNETINKSYQKEEDITLADAIEKAQGEKSMWFMFKTLFVRDNTAELDFEKENNIPINSRSSIVAGDLAYSDAYIKNIIEDTYNVSYDKANSIPNGWRDMGKLLLAERVMYERGELANPFGLTPKDGKKLYDNVLDSRSVEERQVLLEALQEFRTAQEVILEKLKDAGIYSDSLIEQMGANPAYATFQVLDYVNQQISGEIYRQEGTLKDIANPATATVMKSISQLLMVERNTRNKELANMLQKTDPENVTPATVVFNPDTKRQIVIEPKNPKLGVIKWRENGQWKGVYADKYITEVTKNQSNATMKFLHTLSEKLLISVFYRNLFIVWNLQFQSFNLIRDFLRLWKALPTSSFWEAMSQFGDVAKSYKRSARSAWARATDQFDPVIKEMENKKILGLTYNDLVSGADIEETRIERTLRRVGIQKGEPIRLGAKKVVYDVAQKNKYTAQAFKKAEEFLNVPYILGDFFETLPKVAGYDLLKNSGMGDAELREFIRTRVGSPAYRYKGTATNISNNLLLFSNSIIQSTIADYKTATEPSTRAGYWYKTLVANILPQVIKKAIIAGLFGEALKELYEKISETNLANYTIIPLGTDENGRAVIFRVPTDPTGQIINAITWKLLNSAENGLGVDDLKEILSVGGDALPNLNPSIDILSAIYAYSEDRNPYDEQKKRNVIPDKQWDARNETNDAFNTFLSWIAEKAGIGTIIPKNNAWQSETTLTDLQKFLQFPAINKTIGAFIKVDDYGAVERARKVKQEVEGKRAASNLANDKAVDKAVTEYLKEPVKTPQLEEAYYWSAVSEAMPNQKVFTTKEDKQRINNIETKFKTSLLRKRSDYRVNSLIDANSNEEKAVLMRLYLGKMSYEEFKIFATEMGQLKLINQDIINEVFRQSNGE